MSIIVHFVLTISLCLLVTSVPVRRSIDESSSANNNTALVNKTVGFYCAAIKLKDTINELIKVTR